MKLVNSTVSTLILCAFAPLREAYLYFHLAMQQILASV